MNEDVKKFYELMSKDEAIQAESARILKEIDAKKLSEDERNDAYDNSMLAIAKQKGFNFTLEDAKAFNEELIGKFGELSSEDLDQVAGGSLVNFDVRSIASAYAVFPDPLKIMAKKLWYKM